MYKQGIAILVFGAFVSLMTLFIHDEREKAPVPIVEPVMATIDTRRPPQEPMYLESVNIDPVLQNWIMEYCWNHDLSPFLVMAMIERESDCDADCTTITPDEESYGLMQIQPRWHKDRMDRLGVTDLMDPKQNIITGVDYLLEMFEKNPEAEWALNAYNGGEGYANRMTEKGITTDYSAEILKREKELSEEWERGGEPQKSEG